MSLEHALCIGSRQDKKSLQGSTGFDKECAKLAMAVDEEDKAIEAMLVVEEENGKRRKQIDGKDLYGWLTPLSPL